MTVRTQEAPCAGRSLIRVEDIHDGEWGVVYRTPMFRPPGTPRALRLSPSHSIRFEQGLPTVIPSIHYDPGGPWEWHGFLQNGEWIWTQDNGSTMTPQEVP